MAQESLKQMADMNTLLDEDALLLHARLESSCSVPIARLAVKKFTDFRSDEWKSEDQRDEVLSVAYDWCVSEGKKVVHVADQLYSGIENHKLFNLAQVVCDLYGEDMTAEVLDRVKACCALTILGVDAEFRTILAECEGDATTIARDVLLEAETEARSVVYEMENKSAVDEANVSTVANNVEEVVAVEGAAGDTAVTAEQILLNCVKHRLSTVGVQVDDRSLSDFVWATVDDPIVLTSDVSNPSSSLYAFLGSAARTDAMVTKVIAEATRCNLLHPVQSNTTSEQQVSQEKSADLSSTPDVENGEQLMAESSRPAEQGHSNKEDQAHMTLPHVAFGSSGDEGSSDAEKEAIIASLMLKTNMTRQECVHLLEAFAFDMEAAALAVMPENTAERLQSLPDASVLTQTQQDVIRLLADHATRQSDDAMGRLAVRFQHCGHTEEDMIRTLRHISTNVPFTITIATENLPDIIASGQLTCSATACNSLAAMPQHAMHAENAVFNGAYDAVTADEHPIPASFEPAKPVTNVQQWNNESVERGHAVVVVKQVHHRSMFIHSDSVDTFEIPTPRVGNPHHCAHVLETYTDQQLRALVVTATNIAFPSATSGSIRHNAYIHGPVTLANIECLHMSAHDYALVEPSLLFAIQELGIKIHVSNPPAAKWQRNQPFLQSAARSQASRPQRKAKGRRASQQAATSQPVGSMGFSAPNAPNATGQPVALHVALEAEEAAIRQAIEESLKVPM